MTSRDPIQAPWPRKKTATVMAGCLALLFLVAAGLPLTAQAANLEVLAPTPSSIIYARKPATHIIVRLSGEDEKSLGQLRIRSGDILFSPQGSWSANNSHFVHYQVPLKPGENSFEVLPAGKKINVKYRPLRSLLNVDFDAKGVFLFHRDELLPQNCTPCHDPKKIKTGNGVSNEPQPLCISCHKSVLENVSWQHSPALNTQCLSCHQKEGQPLKVTIPGGKVETVCFRCHTAKKAWLGKAHIHGPVGTGDCTVCHNPHGDNNHSQLWADGKAELCVACHTDKKTLLQKEGGPKRIHGILTGAGCIACHDPHATQNQFQLTKPINELCTSCHTSLAGVTRGHPVGGHPVEGVKDPRRPERMFACTSCHNPHGSGYKFLLIGDILGGHVCSQCHY